MVIHVLDRRVRRSHRHTSLANAQRRSGLRRRRDRHPVRRLRPRSLRRYEIRTVGRAAQLRELSVPAQELRLVQRRTIARPDRRDCTSLTTRRQHNALSPSDPHGNGESAATRRLQTGAGTPENPPPTWTTSPTSPPNVPAPHRDHHGRQRPLGGAAGAGARPGAPAGGAVRPRRRHRVRPAPQGARRARLPHALLLQHRELEAAGQRGHVPHADVHRVPPQRARDHDGEQHPLPADRPARQPARPGAGRGQRDAGADGEERRPPRSCWR